MSETSQLRVLLIAESANPEWPSVPLVGWSQCEALRRTVNAHVVTQIRNRSALLKRGWVEGTDFTAIDSERIAAPVWRFDTTLRKLTGLGLSTSTALQAFPYYYFEHLVWRRFGAAIEAHSFDLVHRVTPLTPTIPSLLARRCRRAGVKFIWGPINGGVEWPHQFEDVRRREGDWLSYARSAHKLLPGYRATREDAAALIVASKATLNQVDKEHWSKCVYIPENGIDPARFSTQAEVSTSLPLRIAFVGRLVAYKGADLLIESCAPLLRSGEAVLDIIGDGPERANLVSLVDRLGVDRAVTMHGWIDHAAVPAVLSKASVFAFPSLHEFGGAVVLEAMALGLVPIVADIGGPAELVTQKTGFRIPVESRASLSAGFCDALQSLARDPSAIREMGQLARQRVFRWFTWEEKAKQTLEVYRWLCGQRDKPDFGMPFPD